MLRGTKHTGESENESSSRGRAAFFLVAAFANTSASFRSWDVVTAFVVDAAAFFFGAALEVEAPPAAGFAVAAAAFDVEAP